MRFHSYFNTAIQLLAGYNGSMPLAHYLKNYFAQHKKHGSGDRKHISHLCYCYYRLGHALKDISAEERLKAAIFLCSDVLDGWSILFDEEWLWHHHPALQNRIAFLHQTYNFSVQQIFPWQAQLSGGIDAEAFATSHLVQPNLFLRIRPGKKNTVAAKLQAANIAYIEISDTCFALANTSKADKVLALNNEAVVQDYSSQRISELLGLIRQRPVKQEVDMRVWDCCAASGGKAILVYDTLKNINLTVSDVRSSIIHNLQTRFTEAGIKKYTAFTADLSVTPSAVRVSPFDVVICDAPCSGSGTWGRTPEQLAFFSQDNIAHYSQLQQKIVHNALPHVTQGGHFLYITCSVFEEENEKQVEYITAQGLTLVKAALLTGYNNKADTMFGALFKK